MPTVRPFMNSEVTRFDSRPSVVWAQVGKVVISASTTSARRAPMATTIVVIQPVQVFPDATAMSVDSGAARAGGDRALNT